MTVFTSQDTVNDSATILVGANTERRRIELENTGGNTAYIAGSNAVTVDDYPLRPGERIDMSNYTGDIYAVCSTEESTTISVVGENL